ncbi:terpenoid cyclases/protein prenyltransferase alpha-alpha toroid [Xylariales sp. PMI_506]|nr:terpenoid cyclases/protein prenyltransferase alpha-alpha toroid [Xylariales sp. PMI_506]
MTVDTPTIELDAARHIRFFQRCYKSVLPHHYTSNDSNRLALCYLILGALDLLSPPASKTADPPPAHLIPTADRPRLRAWILSLQHPQGGFCGSPHHVFPASVRRGYHGEISVAAAPAPENANIAATYFALMLLGILADDDSNGNEAVDPDSIGRDTYRGVNRVATLRWLRRLQRADGSFGEIVTEDGTVAGGRDMRYCYMASTIRWVLDGSGSGSGRDASLDFDVDGFVAHIRRSQTFDGGIAESAMGEAHAGYGFCAVAALAILDLAAAAPGGAPPGRRYLEAGIPNIPALARWLVLRQFAYHDDDDDDDEDEEDEEEEEGGEDANASAAADAAGLTPEDVEADITLTGFNGRTNKVADTCYTWWVAGTLHLLRPSLIASGNAAAAAVTVSRAAGRAFLLEKTQHIIGGFGKHVGAPPDVYHAYLGLAALATMAGDDEAAEGGGDSGSPRVEPGLAPFDVRLSMSKAAARRVAQGREHVVRRVQQAVAAQKGA